MTVPSIVLVEHVHLVSGSRPSAGTSVLAAVALYVAVTTAGLLAAPVLTGAVGWRRVRLPLVAVGLGGYVALLGAAVATGHLTAGRMAVASAFALVAGAALPLSAPSQLLAALALASGQVVVDADGGFIHTLVIAVHLLGASVWMGGVLHLVLVGSTSDGRRELTTAIR